MTLGALVSSLDVAGWPIAALATSAAAVAWRALSVRGEAVARACHELRGPLAAARLGLELGVRTGELTRERLRAIDLELGRAGLALRDLDEAGARAVGDLLGRCERVALDQLVADSTEGWRATGDAFGATLRMGWQGGPAFVLGDRLRLAQAIGNVIANAIEHGGGTVRVSGAIRDAQVRIEVSDDGPGLPAPVADLARIARRGRHGRGRGLAIARAIVGAHGGRLAAAPSEHGARIVIELPALTSEPDAG